MVGMQHDFTFFIIPIGMNLKCIFFWRCTLECFGVVVGKVYWNFSDIENAAQLFYDPIFPVFSLARSLAGSSVKLKKSKVCLMIIKKMNLDEYFKRRCSLYFCGKKDEKNTSTINLFKYLTQTKFHSREKH